MKKVLKKVEEEISIQVCDICESEDCPISWSWGWSCPYDDCSSDWGEARFCSVKHFLEGIKKGKLELDSRNDFNQMRFTLDVEGTGTSELTDLLALLEEYASKSK